VQGAEMSLGLKRPFDSIDEVELENV